ncbi:MAG: hypothetical protein II431_06970, partial [Prevotella sp.]|nr:hypothetical protein [Prevotella sp.]
MDQLKEDPRKAYGNDYPYPTHLKTVLTKAPKGYKPFYISHYARHGSRYYWTEQLYKDLDTLLTLAHEKHLLTTQGETFYNKFMAAKDELMTGVSELTQLGWEQHQSIARNMYNNFPEVFKKGGNVLAISSLSGRCVISMSAFCQELVQCNPKIEIREQSSRFTLDGVVPTDNQNPIKHKFPRVKPRFEKNRDQFQGDRSLSEKVMSRVFTSTEGLPRKVRRVGGDLINLYTSLPSINHEGIETLDIYVHCFKCIEAIHKCGNKLIIFENLFFCLKCQKVYNQNHIKLFCNKCNKTYITTKRSLEEKKYDYFYSVSYIKYHCFTENEEKIKCLNCGDDLYYNINNVNLNLKNSQELRGMRDIFCIKCKLIFDTKEIFFTCRICGENFKAEPQIFKNFPSIKKYLLLLVHTFRKNVYALPDIITNKKCSCDLNGVQYFLHKDNGRLFEGNKNGKSVIICDHCYGVFKNENFNWNCPFCGGNFKAIKKNNNMKFDKNRRK